MARRVAILLLLVSSLVSSLQAASAFNPSIDLVRDGTGAIVCVSGKSRCDLIAVYRKDKRVARVPGLPAR